LLLKELAGELLAEHAPERRSLLNAPLRYELEPSLPTSLVANFVSKLGSNFVSKLNLNLIQDLLPDLTRWLFAGLLPMWGVQLRLLRLTP